MDLHRIKLLALVVPAAGLIGFEVFRHHVLHPIDAHPDPHLQEHVISAGILFFGVVVFTFAIFRLLERLHDHLVALNEAGIAVTGELSLDRVLERVAQLARTVANAPHATVRVNADPRRNVSAGAPPVNGRSIELPIVVRGDRLGELTLITPRGHRFQAPDRAALEMFASQAGIALENARLYQEVQELAALHERDRIGMDLHDGVIQHLYALGLKIEDTAELIDDVSEEAARELADVHRAVRGVIGDVRSYVYELRDGDGSVDVAKALHNLTAELHGRVERIELVAPDGLWLSAAVAGNIVQVVREALANAMRHADAQTIRIACLLEDGALEVAVEDDGRGFDPDRRSMGMGLEDMRRRAGWCRGRLDLSSASGRGTTVRLRIPEPMEVSR